MQNQEEILYLNPLKLTGPEQMAIDLFLLEKSFTEKNFHMALRFYTWDGDWLSIGKNQKALPTKWIKLCFIILVITARILSFTENIHST